MLTNHSCRILYNIDAVILELLKLYIKQEIPSARILASMPCFAKMLNATLDLAPERQLTTKFFLSFSSTTRF
jgi:hypothetical protein